MDKWMAKYYYRFDAGELAEEKRDVARFGARITKVESDPDSLQEDVRMLTIVGDGGRGKAFIERRLKAVRALGRGGFSHLYGVAQPLRKVR